MGAKRMPDNLASIRSTCTPRFARSQSEEYLTVRQLSRRIHYAEQTIRNLMSQGCSDSGNTV